MNDAHLPPAVLAEADQVLADINEVLDGYVRRARELLDDRKASYLHTWTQLIGELEEDEETPCSELRGEPHYMAAIAAAAFITLSRTPTDDAA